MIPDPDPDPDPRQHQHQDIPTKADPAYVAHDAVFVRSGLVDEAEWLPV